MKEHILILLLCLLLCSCKQDSTSPPATQHSGLVTPNTFTICGNENKTYPLVDSTGAIAKNISRLEPRPNRSLSAALLGYKIANTNKNLTADSVFVATQIIDLESKNYRNVCIPYDFWILANEPSLSIQISQAENLIEVILPGSDNTFVWSWIAPTTSNNSWTYTLSGENSAQITITKQACSDNMTERTYCYQADVTLNGQSYQGCAMDFSQRKLKGE